MYIPANSTVAVALSGGLDSLMAAFYLLEAGCRVIGLHARFLYGGKHEIHMEALRRSCGFMGISLHVADLRKEFQAEVVEPFIAEYAAGLTPNPCTRCNLSMKFGLLLEYAMGLGADFIATGHYARKGWWRAEAQPQLKQRHHHSFEGNTLTPTAGRDEQHVSGQTEIGVDAPGEEYITIYPAQDKNKDQAYFLALVPPQNLSRVVFPLQNKNKWELRDKAREIGIPLPESKESQEICFVPEDDYRSFLTSSGAALSGEGPVCLPDGSEIARHRGLWQYTEGQRRGLGIAWGEPLYVLSKDIASNTLVVGPANELKSAGCRAGNLNLFVPASFWPENVLARVRYRQKSIPAHVEIRHGQMNISFETPQEPPAKGQLAVIYHPEGFILGGGIIC